MALRKALVLIGGALQELPSADRLTGQDVLVVELAAPVTVAGTTLADIAGLSLALKVGTYNFSYELLITQATATGIVGLSANFTGTVTRVAQNAWLGNSATGASFQSNQLNSTALVDSAARAIGGPRPSRLAGSITVSTAGTLSLRAQRSAGVTTVLAGSSGMAVQL